MEIELSWEKYWKIYLALYRYFSKIENARQNVFFVKHSLTALYKNIGKEFTSGRKQLTCWTDPWHRVPLLGNIVLGTTTELGKYTCYQILKNPQLRLKSQILPFASENSIQFASQIRYFKPGKFKAIITIIHVIRLCLTNEYDCSDLLRVSPGYYLSHHQYH